MYMYRHQKLYMPVCQYTGNGMHGARATRYYISITNNLDQALCQRKNEQHDENEDRREEKNVFEVEVEAHTAIVTYLMRMKMRTVHSLNISADTIDMSFG